MKLWELAGHVPGKTRLIGANVEISSVEIDSRKVQPGALFFCIPGTNADGHDFAPAAAQHGAAALVVERELPLEIPQLLVENAREALAYLAAAFYGNPAKNMRLIGITGTKGKTTVSYLVKSILDSAGVKTGLIGIHLYRQRTVSQPPFHAGSHRVPFHPAPHGRRWRRSCGDGSYGARAGAVSRSGLSV